MATLHRRSPTGPWIARWFNHDGRRQQRSTRTTDRRSADRLAARWEEQSALRRGGVIDPRSDRFIAAEAKALSTHLADYASDLRSNARTKKHVDLVEGRVTRIMTLSRATRCSELTPSAVLLAIGAIRGMASAQTCAHYLRAAKSFSRWLWRDGRMMADPLAHVKGLSVEHDRRYERRDLTDDEMRRLVAAAKAGPTWYQGVAEGNGAMSGLDRACAYHLAAGTGFRLSELRTLTPERFDLDAEPPTVALRAGDTKNRRETLQPIRPDLAETLRPWLRTKRAGAKVLPMPEKSAAMMRRDMAAARKAWIAEAVDDADREARGKSRFLCPRDEAGRVADFHALRHTFITRIVAGGASMKVAQELARHSDPKLTFGRYAHARLHDLTAALSQLPGTEARPDEARQRATGTYDRADDAIAGRVDMGRHQKRHQLTRSKTDQDEHQRTEDENGAGTPEGPKPLAERTLRINTDGDEQQRTNAPGGTRTSDLRFRNPPCGKRGADDIGTTAGDGPRATRSATSSGGRRRTTTNSDGAPHGQSTDDGADAKTEHGESASGGDPVVDWLLRCPVNLSAAMRAGIAAIVAAASNERSAS